jgi:hypothetical protein
LSPSVRRPSSLSGWPVVALRCPLSSAALRAARTRNQSKKHTKQHKNKQTQRKKWAQRRNGTDKGHTPHTHTHTHTHTEDRRTIRTLICERTGGALVCPFSSAARAGWSAAAAPLRPPHAPQATTGTLQSKRTQADASRQSHKHPPAASFRTPEALSLWRWHVRRLLSTSRRSVGH